MKLNSEFRMEVNNKLRGALGITDYKKKLIQVNVKSHKKDLSEIASTVKHEILHANHPYMPHEEVYKRSAKTKLTPKEQKEMLAKLNIDVTKDFVPGSLFNSSRQQSGISKEEVAIRGLI